MATSDNTKTSGGFPAKNVGKQGDKAGGDTKKEDTKSWGGINHSGRSGKSYNTNV